MSLRGWVLLALLCTLGWWYSPISPRPLHYPAPAHGARVRCPMPPRVTDYAEPLQTPVPAGLQPFRLEPGTLTPLAGFSIEGRVLSRRDYRSGRDADFSPADLGLGWGRMREQAVLSRLRISQEVRFLSFYYPDGRPPIPQAEITRSSANLHIIPADAEVARALKRTRKDQRVRVHGWLVRAEAKNWQWNTSLVRTDTGNGACELVYACAIEPL